MQKFNFKLHPSILPSDVVFLATQKIDGSYIVTWVEEGIFQEVEHNNEDVLKAINLGNWIIQA